MKEEPILMELDHPSIEALGSELANVTGRSILTSLSSGPKSASGIAGELGLAMTTVLFHLQKLEKAGLIEMVEETAGKRGRMKFYALSSGSFVILASSDQETALRKLRRWVESRTRDIWVAARPLIPIATMSVVLAWGWTRFGPSVTFFSRALIGAFGEAAQKAPSDTPTPAPAAAPFAGADIDVLRVNLLPWAICLSLASALLAYAIILLMRRRSL